MGPVKPMLETTAPVSKLHNKTWLFILAGMTLLGIGIGTGVILGKQLYSAPVLQPSPTPKDIGLMPEPVPFANWKTYISAKDQLGFSYPPEFSIDQSRQTQNVLIALVGSSNQVLTLSYAPEGIGLECQKQIQEEKVFISSIEASKTITQTYQGDLCENTDNRETIWVLFTINTNEYLFTYHYIGVNNKTERELFDQILSTFKYTN